MRGGGGGGRQFPWDGAEGSAGSTQGIPQVLFLQMREGKGVKPLDLGSLRGHPSTSSTAGSCQGHFPLSQGRWQLEKGIFSLVSAQGQPVLLGKAALLEKKD